MLALFKAWDCQMSADSVGATVYQYWQMFFFPSLFKAYAPENDPEFGVMIAENSVSKQFFQRFFKELADSPRGSKYNKLCREGHAAY
jgi:acyl-homoserine lactone acylase PvdQ